METTIRKIVFLQLDNGKCPFEEWLSSIKEPASSAAIDARLIRVRDGILEIIKALVMGFLSLGLLKGQGLEFITD